MPNCSNIDCVGSKFIYQKYYEERPKLNLQTSIELTSRKILPNKSHILTWRYECTLKMYPNIRLEIYQ